VWKKAYILLYPLVFVVTGVTLNGPEDTLAAAGTLFSIIGKNQLDLVRLRSFVFVSGVLWLCFGILENSYAQIVFSIFFTSGHLYRLIQLRANRSRTPVSL
jgi:hypothetical protein